jgi:hypothetical protein
MSGTYADAFRRILEEEKALIHAEQEKKRLAREAAHKRLKEARRAALNIRDQVIRPMLYALRETFLQGKVPLECELKSAEDHDDFFVLLTAQREAARSATLLADWEDKPSQQQDDFLPAKGGGVHGSRKKFCLKAGISVIDGGPSLSMAVVLPKACNGNDVVVNSKDIVEPIDGQGDESLVTTWYQTQLEDCVRKCVRLTTDEEPT